MKPELPGREGSDNSKLDCPSQRSKNSGSSRSSRGVSRMKSRMLSALPPFSARRLQASTSLASITMGLPGCRANALIPEKASCNVKSGRTESTLSNSSTMVLSASDPHSDEYPAAVFRLGVTHTPPYLKLMIDCGLEICSAGVAAIFFKGSFQKTDNKAR